MPDALQVTNLADTDVTKWLFAVMITAISYLYITQQKQFQGQLNRAFEREIAQEKQISLQLETNHQMQNSLATMTSSMQQVAVSMRDMVSKMENCVHK